MYEIKSHENEYSYHEPKGDQAHRYDVLRDKAKEFALLIEMCCPDSDEKKQALVKLNECSMWANASIARNE